MSITSKPRGIFLNPEKANCSIHESGRMVYDCLKLSDKCYLDYLEVSRNQQAIPTTYDFYAFNYHHDTMGWLNTGKIKLLPGLKLTFVLETLRNDPFVLCPSDIFDVYCALDPTMKIADSRVYAFPRPLEAAPQLQPFQDLEIPIIGSFGFATPGKGFELVVEAANKEFDKAKVRINIPPGTYADPATFKIHNQDYAEYLMDTCRSVAKEGIEVEFTREYMDKEELIQWCSQNTLNCFLYNRNQPGLSATTDQAISSGRPLAVSTNETFRHIHSQIVPYPLRSLKESIDVSESEVIQLQSDWQPKKFAEKFEEVLRDFELVTQKGISPSTDSLKMGGMPRSRAKRVLKRAAEELLPPALFKVARRLKGGSASQAAFPTRMKPFVHPMLHSYSQFNEDLILESLLSDKNAGFYVDVGANDPVFNSNTKRFYDRGWSGINIEPGLEPYARLRDARPNDINLNMGIADHAGEMNFYDVIGDSSTSSFNSEIAHNMATLLNLRVETVVIPVSPLRDIFAQYASDKKIDFLSVDAEGIDLDVLKSNDWESYRPLLVIVEMNNSPLEIINFMISKNYILVFNNEYNGFFVDLTTSDPLLTTMIKQNYTKEISR